MALNKLDLPGGRLSNESMKDLGFKCSKSDAGIFLFRRKGTAVIVAIVYVDDALFCGPDIKTVKEIKAAFMKHWECRDLDLQRSSFI